VDTLLRDSTWVSWPGATGTRPARRQRHHRDLRPRPDLAEPVRGTGASRTIATTGARIRVDFHVNGFPIGSVVRFNQHDVDALFPLEIGVAVQGTAALERVEIVENGVTVHTKTKPRARLDQMAYRWFRPSGPTDGVHRIGSKCNVSRFLYVRVTQRDGTWPGPAPSGWTSTTTNERQPDRR